MKLIKSIMISVILSSFALSTAEAAKEKFDRSKAKNESREKGSGMATGKRQHKPMAVDDDCDVDTDTCKPKGKATDYNSSRSNKADGVAHKPDIVVEKGDKKKPLKHEK